MEVISLAGDGLAADLVPVEELADCAAEAIARDGRTILSYGSGGGYTPLRELLGEWFAVDPYRVVISNGWLQGLGLLAAGLVRDRNVITEYPLHARAEVTLLAAGAVTLSIAVDGEGLSVEELRTQLIQYSRPVLVSTMPTFQDPTGVSMSLERRRGLLDLIAAQDRLQLEKIVLLENDSLALTRFEGEPLPALFDLSGGATVYSSSFSPTLSPGLRVGWFILPRALAGRMIEAATSAYITPVLAAQATVFEFIRRGSLEPHLTALRSQLRLRRDAMLAALERHLGAGARWSRPEGGTAVWLELAPGIDSRAALERAQGVRAVPGTVFGATANFLRLSYDAAAPDEIAEGVARLAAALA